MSFDQRTAGLKPEAPAGLKGVEQKPRLNIYENISASHSGVKGKLAVRKIQELRIENQAAMW